MMSKKWPIRHFSAIVIGASAGGLDAISEIFSVIPANFSIPILIVQHLHKSDDGRFATFLARISRIPVFEPNDKEIIKQGCIYVAPANYHMSVEKNFSISLSIDERVNWSRPSIDVLFESAARVWTDRLVAILLSGANHDGAAGITCVREFGGMTIAQDPGTAIYSMMPLAGIATSGIEITLSPHQIGVFLKKCSIFISRFSDVSKVAVKE